jgi:hypothetical protein
METRQLARLLGALCFEERLEIIGALIPIHVDYMESTGMVSLRYTSTGKVYSADLDLLEKLFNFMNQNYGAGMRLMHRAQAERADATGAMLD